ncbi:hypothetical protein [Gordonia polyisoprenivorans]|uniref:hypothetical protein n=1 Tax=Gordonia polyisoprenivorans TaxID=84595 RepID=UPI0023001161|nr:hypothetical protein [Gordonia polyisoprenivorans]WCB39283.1 hypothetical protein PHA63_09335 [Gordonia polyisoprenivorans]
MTATVGLTVRCSCGTSTAQLMSSASPRWSCPDCATGWHADGVQAVINGANELRRIRWSIMLAAAALLGVAATLIAINPHWGLCVPVLAGGLALLARPTYRRRLTNARRLLGTAITLSRESAPS